MVWNISIKFAYPKGEKSKIRDSPTNNSIIIMTTQLSLSSFTFHDEHTIL